LWKLKKEEIILAPSDNYLVEIMQATGSEKSKLLPITS
jgi:hypothetical protein